jgi:hypothetical protein
MATKEYFVKVSWKDPNQPLLRVHRTSKIDLDLNDDHYKIDEKAEKELTGRLYEVQDFIIDFMIPTGRED